MAASGGGAASTYQVTMKEPTVTTPSVPSGMNVFQNYEAGVGNVLQKVQNEQKKQSLDLFQPFSGGKLQSGSDLVAKEYEEDKNNLLSLEEYVSSLKADAAQMSADASTNRKAATETAQQRIEIADEIKKAEAEYKSQADKMNIQTETDWGKLVQGGVLKGADMEVSGVATGLDFLVGTATKALLGLTQEEYESLGSPTTDFKKWAEQNAQRNQQYFAKNAASSKAASVVDTLLTGATAAIPQAAMALMTAGTSLVGTTAGLTANAAAQTGGLASTVYNLTTTMAKNPQYWTSFLNTAGNYYEDAKASGANDLKATAYGIIVGLLNAQVEVGGGGIQNLPDELLEGGESALRAWVSSAIDEGKEEVVQGVIERGFENLVYGKGNPMFSTSDVDAIINPKELAKEFGFGAAVGGILGGGQTLLQSGINKIGEAKTTAPSVKLDGDGTSQGNVNTATAGTETVAEGDNPIRVGRVTTIRNPYGGPTPVYVAPPNRATPVVPKESVNNAANNIANAHAEELATGRSFRGFLTKAYETIFPEKKTRIDIGVDGLKMDGEEYVVSLYKGVVGKVISDRDISAEKLAVFDKIEEIVRSAEYVGSAKYIQKGDKRKHTVRFDYFETPTTIDGKDYVVSFDVEVFPASNNYRTHRVINEMDIVPVSRADTGTHLPQGLTGQRPSNNTVTEPTPIVKQENVASDGLGAADAGFTTPTRGEMVDTQDKTTTQSRYMTEEEKARFAPEQHERLTAEMSAERAAQYFYNDSEGNIINLEGTVESLIDAGVWDAAQQDAAQVARGLLIKKARESGDWGLFGKLSKAIQNQGTMVAQSLQARKKWVAQSAENIVTEAAAILEKAKKLLPNGDVMKQVSDMAYRYEDAVSTDDASALADIIRETAKIRKTTALMGKSDRLSKTAEWALNRAVKNGDIEFLKTFAANGVVNIASDKVNPSVGTALKTVRRNAMLSKISTTLRNFVSNNIFDPVDSVSRDISVPLDMLLSKFTKTRSVAVDKSWFSKAKREGAMDGLAKSLLEVGLDVDASGSVSRYEGTAQRTFSMNADGKVWGTASKVLSTWEKYNGYALTTTDEAQKGGIEREVQRGINKLYERGLIADESLRNAGETEAKYRTFQDETKLSKTVTGVRRAMNNIGVEGLGAGDLFLPFAQVPANLATRSLEYSPVGLASSTAELVSVLSKAKSGTLTAAEQAHAVQSFGRAVNGTAMIAASVWLAANGLIRVMDTGKDDEDKDMLAMMKMSGQNGTQLNLTAAQRALRGESAEWQSGDTLMSIGFLEPMNAFLTTGALIAEDIKDAEQIDAFTVAKRSVEGTFQSVLDLPVLENIRQISNQYQYSDADTKGGKAMDAVAGYVAGQAASFVPNAVKGIAQGLDTTQRDLYTAETVGGKTKDAVVASLPGLRENAPAKLDSYGREMTTGDPLLNFLNSNILPGTLTEYSPDATMPMLDEVYQATGDAGIFPDRSAPNSFQFDGEKVELTTEEKRQYLQDSGSAYREYLLAIEQDEGFLALGDAAKAEAMRDAKALADEIAKTNVLAGREADETLSKTDQMKRALDTEEAARYLAYKKAFDDVFGNSAKPTSDFISVLEQVSETTNNSDILKLMGEADGFKKWDAANKAGVSTKDYLTMYNAAEGKRKQWQQFDGIVKASAGSDADKLAVMKIYTTTEKSAERLQTAYDDGFTLAQIVSFKKLESEYSKKSDQKERYRDYGFSYNEWKKLYDIFN